MSPLRTLPARLGARLPLLLALGLVAAALVVPVGSMFWSSLHEEQIVHRDGRVFAAVGEVREERGVFVFALQSAPGAEKVPMRLPRESVRERRSVLSLAHYRHVLGDPRTLALVRDSLTLACGAALVALLLGLPAAWALARRRFPLRGLAFALALAPLVLPPFVLGMGAARPVARALEALLGLTGRGLQLATAITILGALLAPVVTLLVARAWARVPAGAYEAALLLGGPRAAFREAVLPRLAPSIAAASVLVVVLALADFAVADLMTFLLPGGGTPLAVFSKEVQLQWKQEQNTGRAVATGAPLLLLCVVGLLLAWLWLRRRHAASDARGGRLLAAAPLTRAAAPWVALALLAPLLLGLIVPLAGLVSWAGAGGETVAAGSTVPVAAATGRGTLFDFAGALERTPGVGGDCERWWRLGLLATLLTLATALVLARWASRGGAVARVSVAALAGLALATPGLVVGMGTLLTWSGVGFVEDGLLRPALALTARCLPVALLGVGLALREARRGQEEAAALLGAGPLARLAQVTVPLALPGIVVSALLVLVLALREIDALVLLETGLFPLRIYDKIHFSRLADETNLALLYLVMLLGPLALLAAVRGWWRARQ